MIDWNHWEPREKANLCFIRRKDELLLIRKKRGLGAGKINAPGGKIEPGESAREAAIRETREEIGVVPIDPQPRGELHFDFADGYRLHCTVFVALAFEGAPYETEEALPFWVPVDAVPYEQMWEDDRHWLPLLLEGKSFAGFFTFDGEKMLTREIEIRAEFGVADDCSRRTKDETRQAAALSSPP